MSLADDNQDQIRGLPSCDAEHWERQFEADVAAGRLEQLAERALRDHQAGLSSKL
jgi:hypothetical protein